MTTRTVSQMRSLAEYYRESGDMPQWQYYQRLIATANGRYHFRQANLNDAISNSDAVEVPQPMTFLAWLQQFWESG